MNFEKIIGNSDVKDLIISSIRANNVLHSYMFIGPDGVGKCIFAKDFANMVLGSQHSLSNHPDFMIIEPEDNKSIKIEQIRYLQEKIAEKPIVSDKKVYIINDADSMTKEAQNCLLKTLEEPPNYAIIILVLSIENKMLTTIRSRCTKVVFKALTDDEVLEYFSSHSLDLPNKHMLMVCCGSIGKALELQNEAIRFDEIDSVLDSIESNDVIDTLNNSGVLYQSKEYINNLLEYINIILMDKLQKTNDMRYVKCIEIVEQTKNRLSFNANFDMSIDSLLLRIWEEFHEEYSWS